MAPPDDKNDIPSPRPKLVKRTSSVYYSPVSKALFPSPLKLQQWIQSSGLSKFASRHHRGAVWPVHDLVATELLMWLLPTHMLTHLIKFLAGLVLLVSGFLALILRQEMESVELSMASPADAFLYWSLPVMVLGLAIPFWVYWYFHNTLYAIGKPWMDPRLPAMNRMDMHVPLRLYDSPHKARRAACLPQLVAQNTPGEYTSNVMVLDSSALKNSGWKFQLLSSVEDGLTLVYQDMSETITVQSDHSETEDDQWAPITVPGHWMLQGFDDIPIYTNKKYPFPCQPPVVPRENPTGVYKLKVDLRPDWKSGFTEYDQLSILLHGIESTCFVFWDGHLLGFCKDSRLPSEFTIPKDLLQSLLFEPDRQPVLHLVMARWSDGSYLEDQDHWWMAGLHRSVELIRRPARADLLDYHVQATASRDLTVSIQIRESPMQSSSLKRVVTAKLFADEQQSPDGDSWKPSEETLWKQTKTVLDSKTATTIDLQATLPSVKLWTAETPILYTLVIEQSDPTTGRLLQAESCRVGFRTIDVHGGILHVNGKRITICGINRHEHDPDHGKVVSLERMKQDIVVLKQNNFNAIRTSHYPTHSSFYRLCDYYGMYVCDEANIETDGMKPMGRLANDWGWENAFVSRVRRMVQRDWNHPCIIMWSLGNESGRGRNLLKARKSVLTLDTSRPICYEGGGSWAEGIGRTELTDIICPMYPDVPRTKELALREDEDRPIILCEYSHSMNNSNGNLHMYWEAFWDAKYPRLQGGFIWDFIDQGLRKHTTDGREYFAYGGDFGDKINDRQFCINGMFSPERKPHPCVAEIRYLQQPVHLAIPRSETALVLRVPIPQAPLVALIDRQKGTLLHLTVFNRYVFQSLSNLKWRWRFFLEEDPSICCEGDTTVRNSILSIDSRPIIRNLHEHQILKKAAKAYLSIDGLLATSQSWAPIGHLVVSEQFELNLIFDGTASRADELTDLNPPRNENPLEIFESMTEICVSNGDETPFFVVDKGTGGIKSVAWEGHNLLCGDGMTPNFVRATTDNDRGGMELVLNFLSLNWARPLFKIIGKEYFSYDMHWRQHGISQDAPPSSHRCRTAISEYKGGKSIRIETLFFIRAAQGHDIFHQSMEYVVFTDGRIKVNVKCTPKDSLLGIPSLPRVGMAISLDPSLYSIKYFGRGPQENYPDRKSGSQLGLWQTSPAQMGFDYIVPSENGNRSDCTWISFDSRNGGMVVMVDSERHHLNFSALLHTADELHQALHTCDLQKREDGRHPIHVNIDHLLMGLGGDISWFPCVYPEFLVAAKEYRYSMWLLPLRRKEKATRVVARCRDCRFEFGLGNDVG